MCLKDPAPLIPTPPPPARLKPEGAPGGCSLTVGAWGSSGWSLITAIAAEAGRLQPAAPFSDFEHGAPHIPSDLEDSLEIHTPPSGQHYSDPSPR